MNQLLQETNYLTPSDFQRFIDCIAKLEVYHSDYSSHAVMSSFDFKLLYSITYYCALRISETINLEKRDFNIDRRILTIRQAKTGKNQKTSIPLPLIKLLATRWDSLNEKLFDVSRQSVWHYGKQIGKLAGLNVFESQEKREIEGVWTHLFRKSYAKWMLEVGASIPLIQVKLRHKGHKDLGSTFTYIKPDINKLIQWESDHHG